MARALILGGGFGGLAAAHALREESPDVEITLVDRRPQFTMGFHKVSWVVGREEPGAGARPLANLSGQGIRFVQGAIDSIDPSSRAAVVGGERIESDALLVALGADINHDAVPGLAEHGACFYCPDHAPKAGEAFRALHEGHVAIGIFGAPYKCPPAPFELALLAHDAAASTNRRIGFSIFSPLPLSLPALGEAGCGRFESQIAMLGIEFRRNAKAERIEKGSVVLAGGDSISFDVLLAVPPHRCPQVAVEAGLTGPSGWIKTNPRTLQTEIEGVWAVGDATGIPIAGGRAALPKSGAFAEEQGRVAGARMAAHLAGRETDATFGGEGSCYLETGGGEAVLVRGRYYASPPEVEMTPPSRKLLAAKDEWEQDRLSSWLGSA